MKTPRFRSALEGWRPSVRRRFTVVAIVAACAFVLASPFEGYRWFGMAIFGFACTLFGLTSLVALSSRVYASQWLEDSTPRDMKYRLVLMTVIFLGGGLVFVIAAYGLWLDTPVQVE